MCRFKSEIAGLWPDERVLRHYKQEFQAEGVWSPKLGSPFSIAGNLRLGFLQPWDQSKTTFLPSRYILLERAQGSMSISVQRIPKTINWDMFDSGVINHASTLRSIGPVMRLSDCLMKSMPKRSDLRESAKCQYILRYFCLSSKKIEVQ